MYSHLELSNPPFSYAVLAKFFSLQLENHRAGRFASKRLLFVKNNFLCVQSLAVEADATASYRDPACQFKVTS